MPFYRYGEVYGILERNSERNINYTILNIFLTLEGFRTACMIGISETSYNDLKRIFDIANVHIIHYVRNQYIIIGQKTRISLLSNTLPIIREDKRNATFHKAMGELLGYMRPMNIMTSRGGRGASISVEIDGVPLRGIMPQRIGDATNAEVEAYYRPVVEFLTKVHERPGDYLFPMRITARPEIVYSDIVGGRRRTRKNRKNRENTVEY